MYLAGNHTFAALKAEESYEALNSMTEINSTINSLISHPHIEIGDKTHKLDIVIGSDYKVNNNNGKKNKKKTIIGTNYNGTFYSSCS